MIHDRQPLVSICIPVYNGAPFLKDCLISAMEQTYNNIEIILVDDCSTDQSLHIAQEILKEFPRKIIFKNETNIGLVANWSKCIELAGGDWIKFLFQDDIMHIECVEKMIFQAIQNKSDFVLCKRSFIFEQGVNKKIIEYYEHKLVKPENIFPDKPNISVADFESKIAHLLHENFIGEPVCWLFHKGLYEAVGGFNKGLKIYPDYEFGLRIILNHQFTFINETLIQFRVHTAATSQREGKKISRENTNDAQIYAQYGDILLLLNLYLQNDSIYIFKKYWKLKDLKTYYLYIYFKACNLFGEERVRVILKNIILASSFADKLKYFWIKYYFYKLRYKCEILPLINKIRKD